MQIESQALLELTWTYTESLIITLCCTSITIALLQFKAYFGSLLQVHCISTEFTMRKHGGEKGVPFRVQIDTFKENENGEYTEHLHSASCQIKVFKVLPLF